MNNNDTKIKGNSDILFIYDAKEANPNGDPDDENKPRMDYEFSRNLVSDVRLKRYIRDYLQDYKDQTIFVAKIEDKTCNATERLEVLVADYKEKEDEEAKKLDLTKLEKKHIEWILSRVIDVRLFGVTIPIKAKNKGKNKDQKEDKKEDGDSKKEAGNSITFTGPIQFNWGYSLNKVDLMDSVSITSHFSSKGEDSQGAIGKDWRVYYSLVGFHGIVSAKRAEKTNLNTNDLMLFDESMVKAISLEATSRSKIGQTPRLYMRIEYINSQIFLGDLREKIHLDKTDGLRSISDLTVDLSDLFSFLKKENKKVCQIWYWQHPDLKISGWDEKFFKDKIKTIKDSQEG